MVNANLYAQTLHGKVYSSESNLPISSNVFLKNAENEVIEFMLVKDDGYYFFDLQNQNLKDKTLRIEVVKYGYLTRIKHFEINSNEDLRFDFILEKSLVELEPINVTGKSKAINIKNDTVTYNPDSFKDGSERVVEDLLQKLPGIRVLDDGTIHFKGKEVKKVLLEGDDLFDQNYVTGTRNISAEIIDKIQAIENFTDNPLLRGLDDSQEVALNLKLKKEMLDMSGNGYVGLGTNDKHNMGVNLIGLYQKYKNFSTISANNIGKNNSPYDYYTNQPARDQAENYPWLSTKLISEENLKRNFQNYRTNKNDLKFASTNHTYKLNAKLNSRLNLNYLRDNMNSLNTSSIKYFFDNQLPINLFTQSEILKSPAIFNADLKVNYKIDDRSLLEVESQWFDEGIETSFLIKSNNSQDIDFNKLSKSYFVKNQVSYTHRLTERKAFLLTGVYANNSTPQNLSMLPAIDFEIDEYIQSQKMNQLSTTSKEKMNLLGTMIGVDRRGNKYALLISGGLEKEELFSHLEQPFANESTNDVKFISINTRLASFYKFRFNKFNIKPSLGLIKHWTDVRQDLDTSFTKHYLAPSVNANYKLSQNAGILFSASYNESPQNIRNLFSDYILTSYRSFKRNTPNYSYQKTFSSLMGLTHNDLYNQFKFVLTFNYRNSYNKYLNKSYIQQNFSLSESFLIPNRTANYSINLNIEKYLPLIKTSMRFDSNNSINEYKNMVNDSEIRNNQAFVSYNELYLRTSFGIPIDFQNTVQLQYFQNKSTSFRTISNTSIQNQFKVLFNSRDNKIFASTNFEYYNPKLGTKNAYHFLDLELRYTLNSKWKFGLNATNITGNDVYKTYAISDFYTSENTQSLNRPYYLMRIDFRF